MTQPRHRFSSGQQTEDEKGCVAGERTIGAFALPAPTPSRIESGNERTQISSEMVFRSRGMFAVILAAVAKRLAWPD
jgi:hypothetical protein